MLYVKSKPRSIENMILTDNDNEIFDSEFRQRLDDLMNSMDDEIELDENDSHKIEEEDSDDYYDSQDEIEVNEDLFDP